MKNFKKKIIPLITLLLIGLFPLIVEGQLSVMGFAGTITVNGQNAPIGTEIRAYSEGMRVDQHKSPEDPFITTTAGVYGNPPLVRFLVGSGTEIQFRAVIPGYQSIYSNNELIANEITTFSAGTNINHFNLTFSTPTASVTGAPENWQNSDATAGVGCSEEVGGSGCKADSYKLKVYTSNPDTCSTISSEDTSSSTVSEHSWVCSYATDNNGHIDFSDTPVEFKVDESIPTVSDNYASDDDLVGTNQSITLSASDTGGSEVNTIKYCTGENCDLSNGKVYFVPLPFITSQDTIVRYQSTDNAGNASSIGSFTLKIRKYDINGGGTVDLADFSVMMSVWGQTANYSDNAFKSDLNANNTVDLADFSILMANWEV